MLDRNTSLCLLYAPITRHSGACRAGKNLWGIEGVLLDCAVPLRGKGYEALLMTLVSYIKLDCLT